MPAGTDYPYVHGDGDWKDYYDTKRHELDYVNKLPANTNGYDIGTVIFCIEDGTFYRVGEDRTFVDLDMSVLNAYLNGVRVQGDKTDKDYSIANIAAPVAVTNIPLTPVTGLTILYIGDTDEEYVKGGIYRYIKDAWVPLVIPKTITDEQIDILFE